MQIVTFGGRPGEPELVSPRWPPRIELLFIPSLVVVVLLVSLLANGFVQTVIGALGVAWFRVSCLVVLVAALLRPLTFQPGTVRTPLAEPALRFAGRKLPLAMNIVLASLATLYGAWVAFLGLELAVVVGWDDMLEAMPASTGIALLVGAVGLIQLVRFLLGMRRLRGLVLDPEGVTGQWGGSPQRMLWRDLHRATIEPNNGKAPVFVLLSCDGERSVELRVPALGSDPMIVAALTHYFRDHPDERALLAQPALAWERFRASFAPQAGLSGLPLRPDQA